MGYSEAYEVLAISVCLFVCLFFHIISQKVLKLWTPSLVLLITFKHLGIQKGRGQRSRSHGKKVSKSLSASNTTVLFDTR